ncbi:hypothetical protein [Leptolyngbya sp. FACHB-8]|uniref:hypothetical protein n=1 Tax=unclassified Leptolyngbya TaxID=2650499 RepID=UPI001689E2DD|nr:hypothetical protein [Leptolyngbya sp. FACHB-8]MBD1911286.1 hypothetical protein [Leptolyngbya sp. FACHB-8]
MSHPRYYPAVHNPDAPHGWSTPEGMNYCPQFGDRLVKVGGQWHIEITKVVSYTEAGDAHTVNPTAIL